VIIQLNFAVHSTGAAATATEPPLPSVKQAMFSVLTALNITQGCSTS
jgi:hypothetical protein